MIKDKSSAEWLVVKSFCESSIDEMRRSNDMPLSKQDTADLRGQIKFAKKILELANKSPEPEIKNNQYLD